MFCDVPSSTSAPSPAISVTASKTVLHSSIQINNTNQARQGSSFQAVAIAGVSVGVALAVTVLILLVPIILCVRKLTQQKSEHTFFELDSKDNASAHASKFSCSAPIESMYDVIHINSNNTDAHQQDSKRNDYSEVVQSTGATMSEGVYSVITDTTLDDQSHSHNSHDMEASSKGTTTHGLQSGNTYLGSAGFDNPVYHSRATGTVATTTGATCSKGDNVEGEGTIVQPSPL